MKNLLYWGEIIVAALLIVAILLQNKAAGLSATFGGSGNAYSSKRGVDKILAVSTVILALLFCVGALAALFV